MLKRNIAMLIAGGLLAAQAGVGGAQSTFPPSTDDLLNAPLPAVLDYFAQRGVSPDPTRTTESAFSRGPGRRAPLPSLAQYLAQQEVIAQPASVAVRTVKTTAATRYIDVEHEQTVKIENEKGQSFVWTADTLGEANLMLQAIAPRNFAAGQTRVFVRHPNEHIITD